MALTIQEIMQAMPAAFVPEKAAGVNTKVQLDFTGESGGQYVLHIHDGQCEVNPGAEPDAKTTVVAAASDFVDIIEGRLDGMKAFMTGKLKVRGDMGFMLKFQQMFDPKRAQQ
jgi:putative sterol carrier protein